MIKIRYSNIYKILWKRLNIYFWKKSVKTLKTTLKKRIKVAYKIILNYQWFTYIVYCIHLKRRHTNINNSYFLVMGLQWFLLFKTIFWSFYKNMYNSFTPRKKKLTRWFNLNILKCLQRFFWGWEIMYFSSSSYFALLRNKNLWKNKQKPRCILPAICTKEEVRDEKSTQFLQKEVKTAHNIV